MAETTASATITLDMQNMDNSNKMGSNDALINAINKLNANIEKTNSKTFNNSNGSVGEDKKAKDYEKALIQRQKAEDKKAKDYEKALIQRQKAEDKALAQQNKFNKEYEKTLLQKQKAEDKALAESERLIQRKQKVEDKALNKKFDEISKNYDENMKKLTTTIGYGLGALGVIGNATAQYAKASNALIGADLYNKPLREAQQTIGRNTAINTGAGNIIGGLLGAPLGPAGIVTGSLIGGNISDYFSSKFGAQTELEANVNKRQQVLSGLTSYRPSYNRDKDIFGEDFALSNLSAREGVSLNSTGTRGVTGAGADNLSQQISNKTGKIYTSDQIQQLGSVMSGLFAHSGLNTNTKKQTEILQKMLDNSSAYGIDPTQYAQQVYQRQQFMGGSVNSAMNFTNMGLQQGWTYANAIQNLERAPVMQRLTSTMALSMVGFKGTYEDLFKKGGIAQLEKKAGNLKDPYNFNAMVLQNAGIDLWALKAGASKEEAQVNNTKALEENKKALESLTTVLMGANADGKPIAMGTGSQFFNTEGGIVNRPMDHKKSGNGFHINYTETIGMLQQVIIYATKAIQDYASQQNKVTH